MNHSNQNVQKVRETIQKLGFSFQIREFSASTRTSAEAASAIGCTVGQIAKSLIFRGHQTGRPILVITSGTNRVNEEKLGQLAGEAVGKADADFVYETTGFIIGGIPPVGHKQKIKTFIDKDLLSFEEIWAAAGSPHAVFRTTPADLVGMTGGQIDTIT